MGLNTHVCDPRVFTIYLFYRCKDASVAKKNLRFHSAIIAAFTRATP